MYQEKDLEALNREIKITRLKAYIPAALLIAGGIAAFILRSKYVTIALFILGGILFIFSADMLVSPLKAYRRHLRNALSSDQKEYTGVLKQMGDNAVEREGVMYYPLCLNVGDPDEEEDDRLLYYDANIPRPAWQLGDRLYIRSSARYVSDWKKL